MRDVFQPFLAISLIAAIVMTFLFAFSGCGPVGSRGAQANTPPNTPTRNGVDVTSGGGVDGLGELSPR